jgi:hypothetical protein
MEIQSELWTKEKKVWKNLSNTSRKSDFTKKSGPRKTNTIISHCFIIKKEQREKRKKKKEELTHYQ